MEALERALLLQGKDLEILGQTTRTLIEQIKSYDQSATALRDQVNTKSNDVARLWEAQSRLSLDMGQLEQAFKAHVQQISVTLNDRVMADIGTLQRTFERQSETGSQYARDMRQSMEIADNGLGARITAIDAMLSEDDDGKVIRRIRSLESFVFKFKLYLGIGVVVGTPIISVSTYLLGQYLVRTFFP